MASNTILSEQTGEIWLNGEFLPWRDANVHVLTHGLHYGTGVFEGERAYAGRIFEMTKHHQRLHDSAKLLGFEIPFSVNTLDNVATELLKRNQLTHAYVRPIAWYGAESLSVGPHANTVSVAMAAWAWENYFQTQKQGLHLTWSKWVRPAPNMIPVQAKTTGQYVVGATSKHEAYQAGFDDILMLDYRGYVAECSAANIFMVKDNILYTPIADCFLNGITRQTVIALAKKNDIPIVEKYILPKELTTADELFITGSAVEIQAILGLDEQEFKVGNITQHLQQAYHKLTQVVELI